MLLNGYNVAFRFYIFHSSIMRPIYIPIWTLLTRYHWRESDIFFSFQFNELSLNVCEYFIQYIDYVNREDSKLLFFFTWFAWFNIERPIRTKQSIKQNCSYLLKKKSLTKCCSDHTCVTSCAIPSLWTSKTSAYLYVAYLVSTVRWTSLWTIISKYSRSFTAYNKQVFIFFMNVDTLYFLHLIIACTLKSGLAKAVGESFKFP